MPSSILYEENPELRRQITAADLAAESTGSRQELALALLVGMSVGGALSYLFTRPSASETPTPAPIAAMAADAGLEAEVVLAQEPLALAEPVETTPECVALVRSTPVGAAVFDQNTLLGTTPYEGELRCEAATLAIVHPQRKSRHIAVEPVRGGQVELEVELERPLYKVTLKTLPRKALIKKDGVFVGMSPVVLDLPAFEPSTISVAKMGFLQQELEITPTEQDQLVDLELAPYVAPD